VKEDNEGTDDALIQHLEGKGVREEPGCEELGCDWIEMKAVCDDVETKEMPVMNEAEIDAGCWVRRKRVVRKSTELVRPYVSALQYQALGSKAMFHGLIAQALAEVLLQAESQLIELGCMSSVVASPSDRLRAVMMPRGAVAFDRDVAEAYAAQYMADGARAEEMTQGGPLPGRQERPGRHREHLKRTSHPGGPGYDAGAPDPGLG